MSKHVPVGKSILDLGKRNNLTEKLENNGYLVLNTSFDLDLEAERISDYDTDVTTAFEILEHLVEPAPVLKNINSSFLVASVPLIRLFEKLNWQKDEWGQHYHEFHTCQFDKLLRHCGWDIKASELWRSHSSALGYLAYPQPKYYIVYAKIEE